MQVRKQQLELDMEQQTGSKSEKEYVKAVYCHPLYLTYMQSQWCLVYSELETIIIFRILSLFQRDPVPNSSYSASGPLFPSLSNHHLLAVCEFAWSVPNI